MNQAWVSIFSCVFPACGDFWVSNIKANMSQLEFLKKLDYFSIKLEVGEASSHKAYFFFFSCQTPSYHPMGILKYSLTHKRF